MPNPIKFIENILYKIRDSFWDFPDFILQEDSSLRRNISAAYTLSIPYSHFALGVVICGFVLLGFYTPLFSNAVGSSSNRLVEGVIMGVDNLNRAQKLSKINPLVPTNIQLEKDLIELIYDPLIKYESIQQSDGSYTTVVTPKLAERVTLIQQGADYQFDLKKGVKWQDGKDFTADDVIWTFELLSQMPENNSYVNIRTVKQLNWQKIDDYSVRICTRPESNEVGNCDAVKNKKKISNLLELISFKILPSHKIKDITASNFETTIPQIYRAPIGTGRFKFISSDDFSITLERNNEYFDRRFKSTINTITFKYYKSLAEGIKAIENGEVHTLSSTSIEYLKEVEEYKSININYSPVLTTQYWALYFNLSSNPDGTTKAPAFFQDVQVRRAISAAIDRDEIINAALLGVAEESTGPIANTSEYYNPDTEWYRDNVQAARTLLDEAGWTLKPGDEFRTDANGQVMAFSLYYVNSFDRSAVARVVKQNLASIGINVIIDRKDQPVKTSVSANQEGWTLSELSAEILAPKSFDVILYGINTFLDPDRYELFHSSQCDFPKLNFACYSGSELINVIDENRDSNTRSTVQVPKVDELLRRARARDPIVDREKRLADYKEFQDLIASDAPVIFLYHPKFVYYSNSTVKDIDLKNVSSLEDRFRNIDEWRL